jgi:hypothetical protein
MGRPWWPTYLDDVAVSGVSWNVLSEPKKVDFGTNGGILSQRLQSASPMLGSISCKNQNTQHFFFSGVLYPTEPNSWTIHTQLSLCPYYTDTVAISNSNHIAKPREFTPFNLLHDRPKNKACHLCIVLPRGYKFAFWGIRPLFQRDLI